MTSIPKGDSPLQKNVLEYLQSSAVRFPNKIAFTDESEVVTFSDLNSRGRALGTYIATHTTAANRPVAVLVERSAATIAAFVGTLYSGNFYVPIESKMPAARIREILKQLDPIALLYTQDKPSDDYSDFCPVLSVQEGFLMPADNLLLEKRLLGVLDADPAYVMFTSGSTGTPKGIVISHHAVIDFVDWMAEALDFSDGDIMANQVPFYFDPSVKDIYLTMKCGATTHIIPKKLFMFPVQLMGFIEEKRATVLNWSTAAFHMVANSKVLEKTAPTSLKKIVAGGETLYAKQLNIWRRALPDVCYVNAYGPTEVTVDATFYVIDKEYADHEAIPIGYICANKEVMLLDDDLQPVPKGELGEICVRGSGLARGYFGDADKTNAAFVQNPANLWYPDLIYRTGDIGVVNEDGLFVYLCRRDGQIKRAGYRIELGEIETALSALPQMRELACFYDENRDKIVCVYEGDIDADGIVAGLRDVLPKYMFPNIFLHIDSLPHNSNGKIDRVRLKDDYFNGKA